MKIIKIKKIAFLISFTIICLIIGEAILIPFERFDPFPRQAARHTLWRIHLLFPEIFVHHPSGMSAVEGWFFLTHVFSF